MMSIWSTVHILESVSEVLKGVKPHELLIMLLVSSSTWKDSFSFMVSIFITETVESFCLLFTKISLSLSPYFFTVLFLFKVQFSSMKCGFFNSTTSSSLHYQSYISVCLIQFIHKSKWLKSLIYTARDKKENTLTNGFCLDKF